MAVSADDWPLRRLTVAYTGRDQRIAIEVDCEVDILSYQPEGTTIWSRDDDLPAWCDVTTRLLLHGVTNASTGESLRFEYACPDVEVGDKPLNQRLLAKVTGSNGRILSWEWHKHVYRRNDARPGVWQGYCSRLLELGHGAEKEKQHWCYGVTSATERDAYHKVERRTGYERVVPGPRPGTSCSWDRLTFQTAILHPDGQVTVEQYVPPVQDCAGGPDASLDQQIQTLAHLRHLPKEVRRYERGVDWRADRDRPENVCLAYETTTFTYDLGATGFPGRTIQEGANPRVCSTRTRYRDTEVVEYVAAADWDAKACAYRQTTRSLVHGVRGSLLYQERWDRRYEVLPHLGILARLGSEERSVLSDSLEGNGEDSVASSSKRQTEYEYDSGPMEGFNRLYSVVLKTADGNQMRKTCEYQEDQLIGSNLVERMTVSVDGAEGETGIAQASYDEAGHLASLRTFGGSASVNRVYDAFGRPIVHTDENAFEHQYAWDDANRLVAIIPPEGLEATDIRYEDEGRVRATSRGVQSNSCHFNAFGDLVREVRHLAGGAMHRKWGYDPGGRVTWESIWLKGTGEDAGWDGQGPELKTCHHYDGRGRLVGTTLSTGESLSIHYKGGIKKTTTASGTTEHHRDHVGRLFKAVDAMGQTTHFRYDSERRLIEAVRREGLTGVSQTRRWFYNGLGWLVKVHQPENGEVLFKDFTVHGLPKTTIQVGSGGGSPMVLRRTYDERGRVLTVKSEDGTVDQAFGYDGNPIGERREFGAARGRLTWSRDKAVEVWRSYGGAEGALSHLETVVWPSGRVGQGQPWRLPLSFGYDAYGNRVWTERDKVRMETGFDLKSGIATSVTRDRIPLASGRLDGAGNLVAMDLHDQAHARLEVGADQHRPKTFTYYIGGTAWAGWNYKYDKAGLLVSNGEDDFSYACLDWLSQAKIRRLDGQGHPDPKAVTNQEFRYDTFGNLTASLAKGVEANVPAFEFSTQDWACQSVRSHLPPLIGGQLTGALHDGHGHLVQIGKPDSPKKTLQLAFDALGRVTAIADPSEAVRDCFLYSAEGLRVCVESWKAAGGGLHCERRINLHDDRCLLVSQHGAKADPKGQPGELRWRRDLVYLGSRQVAEVDQEGVWTTLVDALGTPRWMVDQKGKVVAWQKFTPFGSTLDRGGSRTFAKGFANHEQTEGNGLIYMQSRFYLPSFGRFTSSDPSRDSEYNTDFNWTTYGYCENNPVAAVDPDGRETLFVHGVGGTLQSFRQEFKDAALHTLQDCEGPIFLWNGYNNIEAFNNGADALLKRVIDLAIAGKPINIVAHSHGGNVAFLTSKLLDKYNITHGSNFKISNIITIGTPIRSGLGPGLSVGKVNTVSNTWDGVQPYGGTDGKVPFSVKIGQKIGLVPGGDLGIAARWLPAAPNVNNILIPKEIMRSNGVINSIQAHSVVPPAVWTWYVAPKLVLEGGQR